VASSRIGPSLRSARLRAGWSRETLAYHSGLSWAAISQIESGRRQEVRVSSLVALARALSVTVDYLVGDTLAPTLLGHRAVIYSSDEEYVASTVPFLVEGITRSDCVMAVTSKRHMGLLLDALDGEAPHVEFLDASEWYRSLDGASNGYRTLLRERFERGAPWIRIVGEPVWIDWSEADLTAWARYESMINLSLASFPATIVCTYDARAVPESVLAGARQTHPEVAPAGDAATNPAFREPEDFLLSLR
jgi:transcriptional regulator with XRE-family HTH domain